MQRYSAGLQKDQKKETLGKWSTESPRIQQSPTYPESKVKKVTKAITPRYYREP